jgi:hypothetical protein
MAGVASFLPMAMQIGGSLLQFSGAQKAAGAAEAAAQRNAQAKGYEAEQLDMQAGQEIASSQRAALEQKRTADLAVSRALALAAASGGGASDPGVTRILSALTGEGAYRSLVSLYQGESKARTMRMAADGKRYEAGVAIEEGSQKADAYRTAGFGALASAGGTLYAKYGGGGPAKQQGDQTLISPGSYDSGFEGI